MKKNISTVLAMLAGFTVAQAQEQEPVGTTYWFNGASSALLNASGVWVENDDASKVVASPDLTSGINKLRITKSDVQVATMPPDVTYSVKGIIWYRGWGNFTVNAGNNSRLNIGESGINTGDQGNAQRVFTLKGQVGLTADQAWYVKEPLHDMVFSGGVEGEFAVEKTGKGRVMVGGSTGSGNGNNIYDWPKTTISGGTFQTAATNVFSDAHELVFNGSAATPVTLDLKTFNQTFSNATWRETEGSQTNNTLTTDGTASKFNVIFTGTPALNPMGFGGIVTGGFGITWNPDNADAVFALTNSVSDTQGNFNVQSGVMRVGERAALKCVAKISVASGARFEMCEGAAEVSGTSLEVASGGKVYVADGKQMVFDQILYGSTKLGGGRYTSSNTAWIEGDGAIVVAGNIWTGGGADHAINTWDNWGGVEVDLTGGSLTAVLGGADKAVIPSALNIVLRGILFDGNGGFELGAEDGGMLSLGVQGIQTDGSATAKRWSVTTPMTLSAAQYWAVNGSDVLVVSNKVSGASKLTKDGTGKLQLWSDNDFSGDFNVINGEVHAYSDNAFGSTAGKTTITSGKGTVYLQGCSTHENFVFSNGKTPLKGAAGKVSHVYGLIDNGGSGPNFRLDADNGGELHVHGGVYGNGNFDFNRLYVDDVPLHIIDRLSSAGSIYLNVASNWVGNNHTLMSSGCGIYCRVPYAYYRGPRNENGYASLGSTTTRTFISRIQFNSNGIGIFDLGGYDQETCQIYCKQAYSAKSCVTSSVPAQLHIHCDRSDSRNSSDDMANNYTKFVDAAGCTIERVGKYAINLLSVSSTTGKLEMAQMNNFSGEVSTVTIGTSAGGGGWPNASELRVTGGTLVLKHGNCIGAKVTDVYIDPAKGVLQLDNATMQCCRYLFVYDAEKGKFVRQLCGRTYGADGSDAMVKLSCLAGSGIIKPLGTTSGTVLVIR